jgi:hypothetical protein
MRLVARRGINDADYATQCIKDNSYWRCPFYTAWVRMLRTGDPISEEWLKFTNFRRWMVRQKWEGKMLDRWLLGDGSGYSADNCCFLDRPCSNIARGLRFPNIKRGIDQPSGDSYRVTVAGKHIGYYSTLEQARAVWRKLALAEIKRKNPSTKIRKAADDLYANTQGLSARSR